MEFRTDGGGLAKGAIDFSMGTARHHNSHLVFEPSLPAVDHSRGFTRTRGTNEAHTEGGGWVNTA